MNLIAGLAFIIAVYTVAIVAPGTFPYYYNFLVVGVAIVIANLDWLPSNSYTNRRQVEMHGS